MNKLLTYIDGLPQDSYIVRGDERFINHPTTYQGYDQLLQIASRRKRVVEYRDMIVDGYSDESYKRFCNRTCDHPCCVWNMSTKQCHYNAANCSIAIAKQVVKDWPSLLQYNIDFLVGKLPGKNDHPGPWRKETSYIIDELIALNAAGLYTLDSQPGLVVNNPTLNLASVIDLDLDSAEQDVLSEDLDLSADLSLVNSPTYIQKPYLAFVRLQM